MPSRFTSFIAANFSFANFTAKRRRELIELFMSAAGISIIIGGVVQGAGSYFSVLMGMTGIMLAILAAGVGVSDRILAGKEGRIPCHFHVPVKAYASQTYASTCQNNRNRPRARRSAPKPASGANSKNNSEDGESDPGDQPGPLFFVTSSLCSRNEPNRFPLPWRGPDYRMACEQFNRGWLA